MMDVVSINIFHLEKLGEVAGISLSIYILEGTEKKKPDWHFFQLQFEWTICSKAYTHSVTVLINKHFSRSGLSGEVHGLQLPEYIYGEKFENTCMWLFILENWM